MNMKKLITITAMATSMLAIGAGTFESIPFNQPTYSDADPLGVTAITTAQITATEAKQKATALETTIAETIQKGQLTNDVVIVGNAKGIGGAGMEANTTSIVFAVNRDIDELDAANGEILFAADKVRFSTGIGAIWFGDSTLQSILATAGQGEVNAINTIKVNGSALTPDGDRAVDITIPSAGDANVIESITVNGTALVPDANKAVAITIPDAGQSNVIETVKVNGAALTPDANKAVDITIPAPGDANVIEGITVNGAAVTPDSGKIVALTIPDAGQSNVVETVKVNNVALVPDENKAVNITIPDVSGFANASDIATRNQTISDAATAAIAGINDAQDIATIKSTLTNFLQQLVIPAP